MADRKEKNRERAGYKAMATSVGMKDEWQKVRSYMQTDSFKNAIVDAKEKSKKANDPDAYLASVERKIINNHFSKHEELDNMLVFLKSELGELSETIKKEGDKWVVYSEKGKKKLGEHDTEEEAEKQLAAIHIRQHA